MTGGDVPASPAGAALRGALGRRRARLLLTLGSGLGGLADEVSDTTEVTFTDLGLPPATVAGHAGRFVAGRLAGVDVLVQQGRLHLYEGHEPGAVVGAVRAAADAGADTFVVTNAAGGLHADLRPGSLLAITDQLNLTGRNPLVGPAPVFVDLADAYDPALRALAHTAAREVGEDLTDGVYAGVAGPSYETPAEARMLHRLGADAVGMSTVLEVIAARARGLRVLGLSLVTNVLGPGAAPLRHEDVLATAAAGGARLAAVVRALLPQLVR